MAMMPFTERAIEEAEALMAAFAERTGLTGDGPPRRYLWTDAFAVCNFLGRATSRDEHLRLALRLVEQVHRVLGRHRPDDPRTGWLSGLDEAAGAAHPTRGGLRIGKPLPERAANERFDDTGEWDRDGQYFHYLTRWMHALDQIARVTGNPRYNTWARELAAAAHAAFVQGPAGDRRMVWKMSSDLSRPLVSSMGQHDALDGLITCAELEGTARELAADGPRLDGAIADFAALTAAGRLVTGDPLGVGGLLADAFRVAQLVRCGQFAGAALLPALLAAALEGLQHFTRQPELRLPAEHRLAFRELGLAIGLHALELASLQTPVPVDAAGYLSALSAFVPLAAAIESFWRDPQHQRSPGWGEHRDINEVMLATSLAPAGFLVLISPR
jgi:hypothetical protein